MNITSSRDAKVRLQGMKKIGRCSQAIKRGSRELEADQE